MQALTALPRRSRAVAQRLVVAARAAEMPTVRLTPTPSAVCGCGGSSSSGFHSSAPVLGGGTPGEWNHVWNWKIKQRLAAMKEAGDKAKSKEQGSSSEKKESSASPAAVGPLPGEKVIVLDENLKDGELEAYWAQLRKEREEGGQEKEGTKPKRKTIKRHFLFGWNYSNKAKKEAAAVAGAKAPAQPPKKATASAGAGGKQ